MEGMMVTRTHFAFRIDLWAPDGDRRCGRHSSDQPPWL